MGPTLAVLLIAAALQWQLYEKRKREEADRRHREMMEAMQGRPGAPPPPLSPPRPAPAEPVPFWMWVGVGVLIGGLLLVLMIGALSAGTPP